MKFCDLKTGDVMTLGGRSAVLLAIDKPHPMNPAFWLFIWFMLDDKRISFDMLSPNCDLIPGSEVHGDGLVAWNQAITKIVTTR